MAHYTKGRRKGRKKEKSWVIVAEGETEQAYFQKIIQNSRKYRSVVKTKPELPNGHPCLDGIIAKAKRLIKEGYDLALVVFDKDVIMRNQELLNEFKNIQNKYRAKDSKIKLFLSMPCFEVWLLLHYCYTSADYLECDKLIAELKKYLPKYQKGHRYFIEKHMQELLELLPKARERAKMMRKEKKANDCGDDALSTDIDLLFDKLDTLTK
ncbi:MAG: RloB family protein [Candidatus Cloacimonetes bacterium]|nr:RloB family protein [Candidatus Cloacimonadota bacterium]